MNLLHVFRNTIIMFRLLWLQSQLLHPSSWLPALDIHQEWTVLVSTITDAKRRLAALLQLTMLPHLCSSSSRSLLLRPLRKSQHRSQLLQLKRRLKSLSNHLLNRNQPPQWNQHHHHLLRELLSNTLLRLHTWVIYKILRDLKSFLKSYSV